MSFLTAVLLGLVQGIAEFLPISSSGHLVLLQNIFNVQEADLLFDVLLHVGTLAAVFTVYRRDIRGVIRGAFGLIGIGPDKGKTTRRNYNRRRMAVFLIAAHFLVQIVRDRKETGKCFLRVDVTPVPATLWWLDWPRFWLWCRGSPGPDPPSPPECSAASSAALPCSFRFCCLFPRCWAPL